MEFFKNVAVNIKATGPAAVLVAWVGAVTILGVLGTGAIASSALFLLAMFIGTVGAALGGKS